MSGTPQAAGGETSAPNLPIDPDTEFEIEYVPDEADLAASRDMPTDGRNQEPTEPDELIHARADLARERERRAEAERHAQTTRVHSYAEVAASQAQAAAIQRDAARGMLDSVNAKINSAIEAKATARTTNDGRAEADAEVRLDELRRLREQLNSALTQIPDDQQIRAHHEAELRKIAQPAQEAPKGPSPRGDLAAQWLAANPWAKDADAGQGAMLSAVSRQIHAEGLVPTDPAHFAELTRRISALYPRVPVKGLDGAASKAASKGGPPVAGTRTTANPLGSATAGKTRVQLGPADIAMMRKLKLDPKDKAAQQAYAAHKYADESWEREMGGRR